jgi:hypothetical protein
MKHKHAEIIKAWADGAEIQFLNCSDNWIDVDNPRWHKEGEYRIKPEEKKPVVRWLWAKQCAEDWLISPVFRSKEEALETFNGEFICLEYTRQEFPE